MLFKAIGVTSAVVFIAVPLHFLNVLGFFQHYFKYHPGTCRHVKGLMFGSEDFQILSNGFVFITSGFMFAPSGKGIRDFLERYDINGRIYTVDLKKTQTEANELKIKPSNNFQPSTFRPHGISVLEDTTKGQHLLYVVNHPDGGEDRVEKFRYLPGTGELEHVKSFSGKYLHLTNDLAVTGQDTFFISDYLYYKSQVMNLIERFVQPKFGSIFYFNGTDFTSAARGIMGPNGVVLSNDKRHLYTALTHSKSINVYEVNSDNSLDLVQELNVGTAVDNMHISQDGESLYCGCHPIGLKFMNHIRDPTTKAPSQVLNLPLKDGLIDVDGISQVFYDHGDLISGSSVASIYDKKLLIGSVINKLVVCDLP